MAVSFTRAAARTATDPVYRPLSTGTIRADIDYTMFNGTAASRVTVDIIPDGLAGGGVDIVVLSAYVRVGTAWAGTTTAVIDVGCTDGNSNDFISQADLKTGSAVVGNSAADRGVYSDGRNGLLLGDFAITVDVDGDDCTNLSAGTATVYIQYMEVETATHAESSFATPSVVADPGRLTVSASATKGAPAPGEVQLHKPSTGTIESYSTIAAAIAAASAGETIIVGAGSWAEQFTIPASVIVRGWAAPQDVHIDGTALTGTMVTLSNGSTLRDCRITAPTDSAPAVTFGGTTQAICINLYFAGNTSNSVLMSNTAAGKLLCRNITVAGGSMATAMLCSDGFFGIEGGNVLGGTITDLFSASGDSEFNVRSFYVVNGSPTITDGISLAGTSVFFGGGISFGRVPANAVHITADGVTLDLRDADIRGTTTCILADGGLTGANTTINLVAVEARAENMSLPSGWLSTADSNLLFMDDGVEDDRGAKNYGNFSVGAPDAPSEFHAGEGSSTVRDMHVFTANGANSNTTIGTVTDVTDEARSRAGSTFDVFETGVLHDACYFINTSRTFPGVRLDIDTEITLGSGELSWEYWNGAAWAPFIATFPRAIAVSLANSPYTPYGPSVFNTTAAEQVRWNTPPDWATTTVGGVTGYAARVRVGSLNYLGSAITTSPTLERVKLQVNRFAVNRDGFTEFFGEAEPKMAFLRITPGELLPASGGAAAPANVNISVSSNVTFQTPANWGDGDRAGTLTFVPVGLDTSRPITCDVAWVGSSGTGAVELDLVVVPVSTGDSLGALAEQTSSISTVPTTAVQRSTFTFYAPNTVAGEDIFVWMLWRALDGADVNTGDVHVLTLQFSGYFWTV